MFSNEEAQKALEGEDERKRRKNEMQIYQTSKRV